MYVSFAQMTRKQLNNSIFNDCNFTTLTLQDDRNHTQQLGNLACSIIFKIFFDAMSMAYATIKLTDVKLCLVGSRQWDILVKVISCCTINLSWAINCESRKLLTFKKVVKPRGLLLIHVKTYLCEWYHVRRPVILILSDPHSLWSRIFWYACLPPSLMRWTKRWSILTPWRVLHFTISQSRLALVLNC